MLSRWFDKKEEAVQLRKQGTSIRKIESRLGVPKSTLSGWLRGIVLSPEQANKLRDEWISSIVLSRQNAIKWHNEQKKT